MRDSVMLSLRCFWEDLRSSGTLLEQEVGPVADFTVELVRKGVLPPTQALACIQLRLQENSATQCKFACTLLKGIEGAIGQQKLQRLLFADVYEGNYCEGLFPVDGHPANVRYSRGLFEEAGLAWLCEHEAFQELAMLSDDD
eukprot:TRINITY_DN29187_c0_g1_i1.p2 TRINITY_DN29187_c0_g1~~TRINITY_DN29187_c0_g1_i1.p2  ORF type:complete len:142 (-),score=44.03 TRINITY_DN29187_c0_g1_i1:38-463(-)